MFLRFQSAWVPTYNCIVQKLTPKMLILECMYVRQALDLLEGLLPSHEEQKDFSLEHLRKLIVFSIMWSLGALLELDDRKMVSI